MLGDMRQAVSAGAGQGRKPRRLLVSEAEAGLRLEQLLRRHLPAVSRGAVRRLIEAALVRVDGHREPRGMRVRAGQVVEVAVERGDERPVAQPELPLEVVRVTPGWVALSKPPGMPTHPLRPAETGTLANALVARFPECAEAGFSLREGGIAHRLDASTSGLLLAARTAAAFRELRERFSTGRVRKGYLALVAGELAGAGSIDRALRRMPADPRRMQVMPPELAGPGQAARSDYRGLQSCAGLSLVRVETRSGRRHQVRAHLADLGHPLAGDLLYGGPPLEGLEGAFLHAAELELLPEGERVSAPLPPERDALLRALGFCPVLD
jgi:23S rRNA pseudouridine1911/1915/1917 synthase